MIRKTRQRAAIREVLECAGCPLSPEEVLAAAQKHVRGLGLATIYRNIRSLVDEGWLVPVDLPGQPARYELAGKGHHHHFFCQRCGALYELAECAQSFGEMLPPGFELRGHELLLFGVCPACQRKQPAAP